MDYRKLYKSYYKIEFGSEFEIHHIDGNHSNNEIRNLLLLPQKLHDQLHWINNIFFDYFGKSYNFLRVMSNAHQCYYLSSAVDIWANLCKELPAWIRRKEYEGYRKDGFSGWDAGFNYDMFRRTGK